MANTNQSKIANNKTIDEMFGINKSLMTTPKAQTDILNKQSAAAYEQQKLETNQAQNQFIQNQAQNQLSALDAIRRSNASAIANGANAGLQAANELSAILGLQDTTAQAATDLANTEIENAAAYNAQLRENAVKGLEEANKLNATISANNAELGKALGTVNQAESNVVSSEIAATPQQGSVDNSQLEANRANAINALLGTTANWFSVDADNRTIPLTYFNPYTGEQVTTKGKGGTTNEEKQARQEYDGLLNKIQQEMYAAQTQEELDAAIEKFKLATQGGTYTKANGTVVVAKPMEYENDNCLLPGTLIMMANGFSKPVEQIVAGDLVMTWCSHTGRLKTAEILIAEQNKAKTVRTTVLEFADKTSVSFTTEHGFFDTKLRKYVYIHSAKDAKEYIGHKFLKIVNGKHTRVKLKRAYDSFMHTASYSPCSNRELCVYANGFLSMPGATEAFVNIFKYNRNATYCKLNKRKLIKKYGLFNLADLKEFIPEDIFYAFQGEYLKVKIAKNELSIQDLQNLMTKYSKYLIKE